MAPAYEAAEGHDRATPLTASPARRPRCGTVTSMRRSWLGCAAVLLAASGCGDQSSGATGATAAQPVASPTVVPPATGSVTTTQGVLVSDDGSGPRMCASGVSDL